jgi:hypothetical protein
MTKPHDSAAAAASIEAALARIDQELGLLLHRELVSSDEVSNLLLDVRTLLSPLSAPANS